MASSAGAGNCSRVERAFISATKSGVGHPVSISCTSSASVPCQAVTVAACPASHGMATSESSDSVTARRSQRER